MQRKTLDERQFVMNMLSVELNIALTFDNCVLTHADVGCVVTARPNQSVVGRGTMAYDKVSMAEVILLNDPTAIYVPAQGAYAENVRVVVPSDVVDKTQTEAWWYANRGSLLGLDNTNSSNRWDSYEAGVRLQVDNSKSLVFNSDLVIYFIPEGGDLKDTTIENRFVVEDFRVDQAVENQG
jgi:hypothetical protein